MLSLQQHFVVENRPVPSFLVLDQPTQAFFPSDQATEQASDKDRQDALAQFALVRDIADRLDGRLQIIVLDHADFDEPWFDGAVIERWRDGNALIPRGTSRRSSILSPEASAGGLRTQDPSLPMRPCEA